jgi:thiamine pyrophosphokinase
VADGEARISDQLRADALAADADGPPLIIAADGGAQRAAALGLEARLIVGDLDSLTPAQLDHQRAAGAEIESHPAAKDETDTELALRLAVVRGADRIVLLGGLGGVRFDHALANLLVLTLPELAGRDVSLVDGNSIIRVIGGDGAAEVELVGRPGDVVSLAPLSELVEGITTSGLAYPLQQEDLRHGPTRGISNEMTGSNCRVSLRRGRLAVIHTHG